MDGNDEEAGSNDRLGPPLSSPQRNDKATDAVSWETVLPSGTTGVPMTFIFQGKQHLIVPVGSTERDPEFVAPRLP